MVCRKGTRTIRVVEDFIVGKMCVKDDAEMWHGHQRRDVKRRRRQSGLLYRGR